jgi:methionine aminopeptidase
MSAPAQETPAAAPAAAPAASKKKDKKKTAAAAPAAAGAEPKPTAKESGKKKSSKAADDAKAKPAAKKNDDKKKDKTSEPKDKEKEKDRDMKDDDCSNADVVTKYRTAGDIVNDALKHVVALATVGRRVVEMCDAGDKFITDATGKIYNQKTKDKTKVEKGIAFPTCVSVNQIVGHFSPLQGDNTLLKLGDLIRIDLGAHIDGYCAVAASTLQLGDKPTPAAGAGAAGAAGAAGDAAKAAPAPAAAAVPADEKGKEGGKDVKAPAGLMTGKTAAVMAAAHTASELALRLLKPENKNTQITEMITKVAAAYKVQPVQGVLSHNLKRFIIDGDKVIINRADPEQKVDEITFKLNEAYAIDIVMSSGEGKPKESEQRTTIFKRMLDTHYSLRVKYSRQLLADIDERFPTFPFTLRALDEKTAKIGIADMIKHDLVAPYPVPIEKEGEAVAHIKFTALLLPAGTLRITGMSVDMSRVQLNPEVKALPEDLTKLLAEPVKKPGQKKKKKKPAAGAAGAAVGGAKDNKDNKDGKDAAQPAGTTAAAGGAGGAAAGAPAAATTSAPAGGPKLA